MKTIELTDEEFEFMGQLLEDDMISAELYLSSKAESEFQIAIAKRHHKMSKQIRDKLKLRMNENQQAPKDRHQALS